MQRGPVSFLPYRQESAPMGELIPLADYARGDRVMGADSPWFRRPTAEAPDWDPCHGCPVRGACREVRECQWGNPWAPDDTAPALSLRIVDPPDDAA
jgi:hypothetical protein